MKKGSASPRKLVGLPPDPPKRELSNDGRTYGILLIIGSPIREERFVPAGTESKNLVMLLIPGRDTGKPPMDSAGEMPPPENNPRVEAM